MGKLTVMLFKPTGAAEADKDLAAIASEQTSQVVRSGVDEYYFHRLRLRVAEDPSLTKNIEVLYQDPAGKTHSISLEDPWKWPPGFMQELWEEEVRIMDIASRKAAKP